MRRSGRLDYLEMPATGGTLDRLKAFYSTAFAWSFTDYGPTYSAFAEGLDGGFQADAAEAPAKPLPVLYSENLEETLGAVEGAGGTIVKPIFPFPSGRRFHFVDPAGKSWLSGAKAAWTCQLALSCLPNWAFDIALRIAFSALLITRRTSDSDGNWGVAKW